MDLGARTRTWSGFASDTLQLAPRTYLNLSGRYNRVAVRNRDAIIPGVGLGSLDSDQRFARFNPALGGFPGVEGSIAIASGNRLPLVPRQMAKFYVELPLATGLQLGLDIAAVGSSIARGNENNRHQSDGRFYIGEGRNPGYAVMNLDARWKLKPGLTLFAKVDNLLDRDYSTAAQLGPAGFDAKGNFVARPLPADANGDQPLRHSTFYAPGAPRTWWVGLRMTLGD